MAMPVLATKFFIPPLRPRAVSRPRLIERLHEGLRSRRKLTLSGNRYHRLFADVLRARLLAGGSDRVSALHCLASDWYESNGLSEEAVGHALAAPDFDRAARVIEAATSATGYDVTRGD